MEKASVELGARSGRRAPATAGRRTIPPYAVLLYGCWATTLAVLYLAVPTLSQPAYALLVLSATGATVAGVVLNRPRRRSPWLLLAAAYVVFAVGSATAVAYEGAFPSWADAIFLGGSLPLLLIGLHRLTRSGAMVLDRATAIDAVILTIGAGFLAWTFLINPFLQNPSLSAFEKAVSIAYPLTDVLMLALLARLGLSAARCLSAALLIASGLSLLSADSLYGLARLNNDYLLGGPTDLGWMLFFVFGGLAALHPSMVRLTEPQVLTHTQMSLRRGVLTVASLLAPTALLLQALRGPVRDGVVIAAVSAVLILLALARMSAVAVSLRQTLARERQLRLACEALLQSSSADEVTGVLRHAVGQLLLDGTDHRVVLALHDDDGSSPDPADLSTQMELVYVASLPAADELAGFDLALRCPLAVGGNRIGDLLVGAAEPALVELHESLPVLAGQAATMIDRIRLNREISRRDSQAYFRTLVLNASEVIAIVADDNRISYVSPSALRVFGSADLIGTSFLELIEPDMCDEVSDALAAVRAGRPVETLGLWPVRRIDGTLVHAEVAIGDMRHDEGVNGLVLTLRDVTERIGLEQELIARAYIDPLTGLGNRLRFQDDVAAAAAAAGPDRLGAVLVVNVDDFRAVNDTMGHEVGDELLIALGERLSTLRGRPGHRLPARRRRVRPGGRRTPATPTRWRISPSRSSPRRPWVCRSAVRWSPPGCGSEWPPRWTPVRRTNCSARPTWPWTPRTAAPVPAGAGTRRRCTPRSSTRCSCARTWPAPSPTARSSCTTSRSSSSARAVRWDSRRCCAGRTRPGGWSRRSTFIPLAEDSGLIVELGDWVLRTAIRAASQWALLNPRHAPYVSVNVSVRQLRMPDFVDPGAGRAGRRRPAAAPAHPRDHRKPAAGRARQIPAEVARLRKHGIKVSIDDFGTGYSSLSYLHQVPVDVLKLDKSFVDTMTTSDRQHALVRGILQLAATLSLPVVAEGIETEAEHRLLADAGCAYGQGFLFARPLTEQDAQLRIEQEAAPVG